MRRCWSFWCPDDSFGRTCSSNSQICILWIDMLLIRSVNLLNQAWRCLIDKLIQYDDSRHYWRTAPKNQGYRVLRLSKPWQISPMIQASSYPNLVRSILEGGKRNIVTVNWGRCMKSDLHLEFNWLQGSQVFSVSCNISWRKNVSCYGINMKSR